MVVDQWERDQWNEPSRSDHYLMQTACEAARPHTKNPNSLRFDKFKIPFKFVNKVSSNSRHATHHTSLARMSAGRVGSKTLTVRKVDRDGNLISEERISNNAFQ